MADTRLGVRANAPQLAILVALTALVGALVGVERSVLPLVGERDFGLASKTAVLTFVVAFGAAKAVANLAAAPLALRVGRRRTLLVAWLLAVPVPALLAFGGAWAVVVGANVLLGASQGLAWSMTVVMKVDVAGPARRGLVLGLNESAGYLGVAAAAFATGALAGSYAPRTVVWTGAAFVAVAGLVATAAFVRDTAAHAAAAEEQEHSPSVRHARVWPYAQAGFATNLNDAVMWGLVPIYLGVHGATAAEIGAVAAAYPLVWGLGQTATGWVSDSLGRGPLIVGGMLLQGAALVLLAAAGGDFATSLTAAVALGAGTALVYPVLLAAVSDSASPLRRPHAIARYRFWRDTGLVVGALAAGVGADAIGNAAAILGVAGATAAGGIVVAASGRGSSWFHERKELAWLPTARS